MRVRKSRRKKAEPDGPDRDETEDVTGSDESDLMPRGPKSDEDEKGVDFFDLTPGQVEEWSAPGVPLPSKRRRNFKPFLIAGLSVIGVALIVTVVVLLWPSSVVRVPDVEGKMLDEAMDSAREAGLLPTVQEWSYSQSHSDGTVLSQEPTGNETTEKGDRLLLTVSKGPSPEPTTEPTPIEPGSRDDNDSAAMGPLAGRTVCIDPGHQRMYKGEHEWVDPGITMKRVQERGAKGVQTGNPEYLLTIDIAMKLEDLLEKDGVEVVMTRESNDVDLPDITRAEIANSAEADLCVQVHMGDSRDASVRGSRVLYPADSKWTEGIFEQSKTAAIFLEAELVRSCETEDLGVSEAEDLPGFNWSEVPVVKAEVAYLSNPDDDWLLADDQFRWKAAWGLRNGIAKYLTSE